MTKEKDVIDYFNRWPEYFGSKMGACDVLVVKKDGTKTFYENNGCHGIMYNVYGNSIDYVYSSLWCRDETLYSAALEYWGYLLDPTISPFKLALPNMVWVKDDKDRPLAFGIKSQGVPNQYCVPLMMQCRVPQENTNKLRSFAKFREHGFDLVESFFLSEHYYLVNGSFYKVNSSYEHAFGPSKGMSFEKIKNSAPAGIETTYNWQAGRSHYTPVTSMWATSDGKPSKVWDILDVAPTYKGVFTDHFKREKGSLDFPKSTSAALSVAHVIDTLKANRTGW